MRDPKGLYKDAAAGKVSNLTGIQDPYEPPNINEIIVFFIPNAYTLQLLDVR